MKKISAKIIADSVDSRGNRITSFILTYPRFIHSELMTHRMFSRNSASSRAIPFEKMLKMVEEDPFIPIAWQKDHKGMQGSDYINVFHNDECYPPGDCLEAKNCAVTFAKGLNYDNVTKQLCNRLLEPFMWHTVLVTATEYENFFDLRCPKYETRFGLFYSKKDARCAEMDIINRNLDIEGSELPSLNDNIGWLELSKSGAEIHIQALAEAMWDAYNKNKPTLLSDNQWHIPFGDQILMSILDQHEIAQKFPSISSKDDLKCRIAVARCARLSYMTFDGEINYEKDIQLFDTLLKNKHASPCEHVCQVLTEEEYNLVGKTVVENDKFIFSPGWVDNYRGFKSYRRILNF